MHRKQETSGHPCVEMKAIDRLLPFCQSTGEEKDSVGADLDEMENCQWLQPKLVAQIEFTEWTPDEHLRGASFAGLRDDKDPGDVVRETED